MNWTQTQEIFADMLAALQAAEKMFEKACRDTFSAELSEEEIQAKLNESKTVRQVRDAIAKARAVTA